MGIGIAVAGLQTALAVHAVAAPLIFAAISAVYFRRFASTGPFATAVIFVAITVFMDVVIVAALIQHSFAMFTSVVGTWLPFALIFGATGLTGLVATKRRQAART
jgi:hypothetical protein